MGHDVRDNRLTSQTLAVNVNFVRERLENGFSSDSKLARVFMQIPNVNPSLKVNLPCGITHYPTQYFLVCELVMANMKIPRLLGHHTLGLESNGVLSNVI